VKGAPGKSKTIQDIAFAAYTNHPQGMEAGLEAVSYYDPPNLTYPFGSYICVVDVDSGTGVVKVRRFVAIDDCGNIINPMIVQGQVHGGLTMGLAPALYEEISYDEAKGVGESATVGAPAAIANAVVDALWHVGVRHVDIPITPAKVWKLLRQHGVND
jgi:carbon-monoxide dehydrogenase large subunit